MTTGSILERKGLKLLDCRSGLYAITLFHLTFYFLKPNLSKKKRESEIKLLLKSQHSHVLPLSKKILHINSPRNELCLTKNKPNSQEYNNKALANNSRITLKLLLKGE